MLKKIDPTVKAVALLTPLLVAPFIALAFYVGVQASPVHKVEAGGFRWRGLPQPAKITKVAEMPDQNCTLYRVDTEGTRLYVTSSGGYQSCSVTSATSDQK